MKRITENGTRKILFKVEMPGVGSPAVLNLIRGGKGHNPYIWIGSPNDGPCIGTLDKKEMLNLARAITRESE